MKAKFEFDLPEEREEFEMYSRSSKMYNFIYEFGEELRRILKYDSGISEEEMLCYEKIRNMFLEMMKDSELEDLF